MKKRIVVFLMMCLVLFVVPTCAYASSPKFSAYPVLPENQISSKAYFDLIIKPNQSQELILALENYTSEEITVQIEGITATTASSGEINLYLKGTSDVSLVYPFSGLIEPNPKTVTIPAKTLIEVPIRLTSPSKSFEGVILGGLCVMDTQETEPDSKGFVNLYPSVIPVKLTENQERSIVPNFQLSDAELLLDEQTMTFRCGVRNPVPELFLNTQVEAQILQADSVLFSYSKAVEFAPNSVFPLKFSGDAGTVSGTYTARVTVTHEDESYVLEEIFVVGDTGEIEKMQEISAQKRVPAQGAMDLPVSYPWIQIILLICVVLIIIVWFVIYRKKKNKKKEGRVQK